MTVSDDTYASARALIARRLGLDVPEGWRPDLECGLARVLRRSAFAQPRAGVAWLATLPDDSAEWLHLSAALTVGETCFFRDAGCFATLEREVLPSLIAARRVDGGRWLRLWSAGCASGEEAYSLAILLDRLLPDRANWSLTILATDLDSRALETARRGVYRERSLRQLPRGVLNRHFHGRRDGAFELDPEIRRLVTFARLNLAAPRPTDGVPGADGMDLILCRNVLMYFTPEARRSAAARLVRALLPGGWLSLAAVESSAPFMGDALTPVNFPDAVFFRKPPLASVPLPLVAVDSVPTPPPPAACTGAPPAAVSRRDQPLDGVEILHRARVLADRGQLDEARQLCEAAVRRDPLDGDAHLLLATIHQGRGDPGLALRELRRCVYLAPDWALAHFVLGSFLLGHGKRKEAARSLRTVVRLLHTAPRDEPVPGSDGLTAGRLVELAQTQADSTNGGHGRHA